MSLRGGRQDDAAIHRVSENAGGLSVRVVRASGSPRAFSPRDDKSGVGGVVSSLTEDQWIATGLRPRDDKGGGICDDNNWRKGTVRAYFSLFTLHSSLF